MDVDFINWNRQYICTINKGDQIYMCFHCTFYILQHVKFFYKKEFTSRFCPDISVVLIPFIQICLSGYVFSLLIFHPEGTWNNPDILQEYQKILIGFYNGVGFYNGWSMRKCIWEHKEITNTSGLVCIRQIQTTLEVVQCTCGCLWYLQIFNTAHN